MYRSNLGLDELCRKIIEKKGEDHQLIKVVEELGELQDAILKHMQGRATLEELAGETVDVKVTVRQLEMMINKVDSSIMIDAKVHKLDRLERRIDNVEV